jgi:hypothetical protein
MSGQDSASDQQSEQNYMAGPQMEECVITESLFGVVGDHGNSLMIYDTDSIVLRHQIHVG